MLLFNKKEIMKFSSICIIIACGVVVCNLFMNYCIDLINMKNQMTDNMMDFYKAMKDSCISISLISGGSLTIVSLVMVVFYIKNFIDNHSKELGILKALGYSSFKISSKFYIFGLLTLIGSIIGYLISLIIMPFYYEAQNANQDFINIKYHFNFQLILGLIIIPTIIFLLLGIIFAFIKLKDTSINLIKGVEKNNYKRKEKKNNKNYSFCTDMKISVLTSKKSLIFFALFAPFCFSANIQLGISMKDYASELMQVITILIGTLLAIMILYLAMSSLIKDNMKNISLMNINGYSMKECKESVLDIYRPLCYLGFAIGTLYQYGLMKFMLKIIFKDIETVEYKFNFIGLIITFITFILLYEAFMYVCSNKIKKIRIKEVFE